ncbi:MAG TPA: hypothetical protein VN886_22665 [Acidimicrobiales bacterium]|nr:hypothetical protein [Acidimicrobiales bacterium]
MSVADAERAQLADLPLEETVALAEVAGAIKKRRIAGVCEGDGDSS